MKFPPRSTVMAILALAAGAPTPAAARIRPGVEIGLNYSMLNYYHTDFVPATYWDPGWRPSFTGGLTLQVPIRGRFELATGLRYVQQGNRVKFDEGVGPSGLIGEFRLYQDYLSVPALVTYFPTSRLGFFVSLGPEIGYLVAARDESEFTNPSAFSRSNNDKDYIETTNVMVDASTGYEFPMGKHVGTVSARYTRGLTGIGKNDKWATDFDTRGVELLTGLRW